MPTSLAFMDIMPRCEGHMLVIPKTPARNVLDASPAQLAACIKTVQKVANAAMKAFGSAGITIQQFNEVAGGQVVFHLHFHVMPRSEGVSLGPPASKMEKPRCWPPMPRRSRSRLPLSLTAATPPTRTASAKRHGKAHRSRAINL